MSYSYPKQLKKFWTQKSVFKWWKTSDFILSPCNLIRSLHPMFTLRYQKSRDNLSSSDVKLPSRIVFPSHSLSTAYTIIWFFQFHMSKQFLTNKHFLPLVRDSWTHSLWFPKNSSFLPIFHSKLQTDLQNYLSTLGSFPFLGLSTWILFLLFLYFMPYRMTPLPSVRHRAIEFHDNLLLSMSQNDKLDLSVFEEVHLSISQPNQYVLEGVEQNSIHCILRLSSISLKDASISLSSPSPDLAVDTILDKLQKPSNNAGIDRAPHWPQASISSQEMLSWQSIDDSEKQISCPF